MHSVEGTAEIAGRAFAGTAEIAGPVVAEIALHPEVLETARLAVKKAEPQKVGLWPALRKPT